MSQARLAPPVLRALHPQLPGQLGQPAPPERRELRGLPDQRGLRGRRGLPAPRVQLALLGCLLQARPDPQGQLELIPLFPAPLALQAQPEPPASFLPTPALA